ncbi:2108_t:CDS:1, partial [Acaulospora morrowiae]
MDNAIIPFQFEEIIDLDEDGIATSADTTTALTDITPFTFFTTSGDSLAK